MYSNFLIPKLENILLKKLKFFEVNNTILLFLKLLKIDAHQITLKTGSSEFLLVIIVILFVFF